MNETVKQPSRDIGCVLTCGLGGAVAMWGGAYFLSLPAAQAPLVVLFVYQVLALVAAGYFAGRFGARGLVSGALAGLVAGIINTLLIAGIAISTWLVVAPIASMLVAAVGGILGSREANRAAPSVDWPRHFAGATCAATLMLLAVGGVVTGNRAGLAVPDWPNTFGSLMFLYPIGDMLKADSANVFYEHSHRLIGALVGLATLTLAIFIQIVEPRGRIRVLCWIALIGVVIQGVMGGLRVTQTNLVLAIVHGVFAQAFFSLLIAIRMLLGTRPGENVVRVESAYIGGDRRWANALIAVIAIQLVLGAVTRHMEPNRAGHALWTHMGFAMVVVGVGFLVAIRVMTHFAHTKSIRRLASHMLAILIVQFGLGFAAWGARGVSPEGAATLRVIITTIHQTNGAVLLANAVMIAVALHTSATMARVPSAAPVSPGKPVAAGRNGA